MKFGRWLHRLDFTPGTAGNLSVRLSSETVLATPTGCSKRLLRRADMVIVDLQGMQLAGSRNVTSEMAMHLAIYNARPDVKAVIHSHPPIATAFACSGRGLDEPICAEAVMALGAVPLAPYGTTGTAALSASLAPFIPGHTAILMANHGAVTYGPDLLNAFLKMETLEHLARISLAVHQLGSPHPLAEGAVNELLYAKTRYLERLMRSATPSENFGRRHSIHGDAPQSAEAHVAHE